MMALLRFEGGLIMKIGDKIDVVEKIHQGYILSIETGMYGEFYKVKIIDGPIKFVWPCELKGV